MRKPVSILGISGLYHDSAAVLLVDGKIIYAAQEERFTRKKHDFQMPVNAIKHCLAEVELPIEELDYVVFYEKPLLKFERLLETYFAYAPDKPNILLDEVIRQVPVDQLTAFLALKAKNLPDPMDPDVLRSRISVQENTFKEFCGTNNIEFLSLTEALKEATFSGTQTYFTYDQHWTPEAHSLVADYLTEQIN